MSWRARIVGTFTRISTFSPAAREFLAREQERAMPVPIYLLLLLNFASLSDYFIYFFVSNYLQMSLYTVLLEGILSYNPPGSTNSLPSPSIIFHPTLPSLQHC